MATDMNVDVTFEGDNTVLMQQVSVSAVESLHHEAQLFLIS